MVLTRRGQLHLLVEVGDVGVAKELMRKFSHSIFYIQPDLEHIRQVT